MNLIFEPTCRSQQNDTCMESSFADAYATLLLKVKNFWSKNLKSCHLSLFTSSKLTISLILFTNYRHCWSQRYAGRVSCELRSPLSLCVSVVEHRSTEFRRSEVRFLLGTQNFFCVPRSWQDEKHLSLAVMYVMSCIFWIEGYFLQILNSFRSFNVSLNENKKKREKSDLRWINFVLNWSVWGLNSRPWRY